MKAQILTANVALENQVDIKTAVNRGAYESARKALSMSPDEVIEEVKESGIRGRGGAGFPTGIKWGFVPRDSGKPVYLINNCDESEPGTFKDRLLVEKDPHMVIEGMIIASWALKVNKAFIYMRGEYAWPADCMSRALEQAYDEGFLGKGIFKTNYSLDIILHRGAGAYICGEETALIESLEGKNGQPRIKPPFPAICGLYGCPTVVNNVETLSVLPWILANGGAAYKKYGTEQSPGTKLFSVSGHVNCPGVYEVEMGYPMLDFIKNECGGVLNGNKLKAVIPGGSSVPVLRADELEGVCLDYESLAEAGTLLGSGGMIIMDETTDMVEAAVNLQHFYRHESCGQCTPCREGVRWIEELAVMILKGNASGSDLMTIESICSQIAGHTICPFGSALITPILGFMKKFPEEFSPEFRRSKLFEKKSAI